MTPRFIATRQFAIAAHGEQLYGENKPYIYHLDKACDVLRRFGFTEEKDADLFDGMIAHDIVEDTPTTVFHLLQAGFSQKSVMLIHAVSNEQGRNRAERHEKTYGKIASTEDAIILKLADRIANVEEGGKIGMYRKEHLKFIQVLGRSKTTRPSEVAAMWDHLNKLIDLRDAPVDVGQFRVTIPNSEPWLKKETE